MALNVTCFPEAPVVVKRANTGRRDHKILPHNLDSCHCNLKAAHIRVLSSALNNNISETE